MFTSFSQPSRAVSAGAEGFSSRRVPGREVLSIRPEELLNTLRLPVIGLPDSGTLRGLSEPAIPCMLSYSGLTGAQRVGTALGFKCQRVEDELGDPLQGRSEPLAKALA